MGVLACSCCGGCIVMEFLTYIVLTFFAALIDDTRISESWGKVKNINHKLSVLVGGLFAAIVLVLFNPEKWQLFLLMCVCLRGVFYDPFLNLLRGLEIDYTSETTDSVTDQFLKDFWVERLAYFVFFIALSLYYYG
jgi:hypothetical protein